MLTAYHCVAELSGDSVDCQRSRFGPMFPTNALDVVTDQNAPRASRSYRIREIIGPNANPAICGADIALLVLDSPIPANVAQPVAPRLEEPAQPGEPIAASGYGMSSGNQNSAGLRRRRNDGQVNCIGRQCGIDEHMYATEIGAAAFTCQGDSGGPIFDAQERVIGVTSRGPVGCNADTAFGIYTSVYTWGEWIRNSALRVANQTGVPAEPWARPPVRDDDMDTVPDDVDNCLNASNPDQGDLDEDGVGDACDPQLDRECSVCRTCAQDSECGPGAYCGDDSRCYMTCRTNADCPGGDSTTCEDFGTFSVCVNSDYGNGQLCPEDFQCGQVRRTQPETPTPVTPEERPDTGETPNTSDTPETRPNDVEPPKADEFPIAAEPFDEPTIDTETAEPTLNPFAAGGCTAAPASEGPLTGGLLSLLTLVGLLRRRRTR